LVRVLWSIAALISVFAAVAAAQTAADPHFEVASVRPAGPDHDGPRVYRTGPGTADPEHIWLERATLLRLINLAYGVDFDQISGPKWIGSEYYSIRATVPPGTTIDAVRPMWQRLLAERFHLKVHLVSKEFGAYELSTLKSGPKFRESAGGVAANARRALVMLPPRNVHLTFRDFTMKEFVALLAHPLGAPGASGWDGYLSPARVRDNTGLNARYDFTLEFAGAWRPGGAFLSASPQAEPDTAPDLFGALTQQPGLQLKQTKLKLDVVVVDHADRVPGEN
jgi:uncharacterized protein (TIGR03435 family)